ncbi:PhzF family phenazine biosynthesis protein [Aquabacter sp. CN5-332]|uniref:PhzF family phenazine biosynthesis protein n=1 Tax=Aquabacter sp. CN5-332 TaxID=3156608 RepID=UPI0032B5F149
MSRRFEFMTVDVFTVQRFGGNPLAVFYDAEGLSDAEMQSLAAEMNLSETTFVLPPASPENHRRVRIFNRSAEMPFAGHPNVGTACALAMLGLTRDDALRFEETAGLVGVELMRDQAGAATGATINAPKALDVIEELAPDAIAECIGLSAADIRLSTHAPVIASVGVDFALVEVSPDAVARATPRLDAFRSAQSLLRHQSGRLSIHLYSRSNDQIRARMFAPLAGTWEDPATGSANAALAALLVSLGEGSDQTFQITQGVEMARASQLVARGWRVGSNVHASVGGSCVPMFRGHVEL